MGRWRRICRRSRLWWGSFASKERWCAFERRVRCVCVEGRVWGRVVSAGVLGQRRRCGWEVGVYDNVCGLRERDGYGRKGVMKTNYTRSLARSLRSLTHNVRPLHSAPCTQPPTYTDTSTADQPDRRSADKSRPRPHSKRTCCLASMAAAMLTSSGGAGGDGARVQCLR